MVERTEEIAVHEGFVRESIRVLTLLSAGFAELKLTRGERRPGAGLGDSDDAIGLGRDSSGRSELG